MEPSSKLRAGTAVTRSETTLSCVERIGDADVEADDDSQSPEFPNTLAKWRHTLREPLAEFLGMMVLIIFGTGADCQVVTSTNPAISISEKGSWLSIALAWGMGIALGFWVSGGVSGGHLNPCITLSLAMFRRFPLKKVPIYIGAQILGAFVGSMMVFANYWSTLVTFEGGKLSVPGTAGLFTTFPAPHLSIVNIFFSEVLGMGVLIVVVLAIMNKGNPVAPPPGLIAIVIFMLIASLGSALAYSLNPARDLGPRLMTAIFYGREVFTHRHHYWIWAPIMGDIVGAVCGGLLYDICIYTGDDSWLNSPNLFNFSGKRPRRRGTKSRHELV